MFIKIFEQRPGIWKKYVNLIKDNIHRGGYENIKFDLIWNSEKWQECIDYAFSILLEDSMVLYIEESARLLFGRAEKELGTIRERKKQWLLNKLHESSMDISKSGRVIDVVVNVLPEWKLEFILEYLKDNKRIEDFKKIHLFPLSVIWSGSEVPLIIDKIQFLQLLKEKLKGVDYIDHRAYIEKSRRNLEEYKEKVELREYIEEADYA